MSKSETFDNLPDAYCYRCIYNYRDCIAIGFCEFEDEREGRELGPKPKFLEEGFEGLKLPKIHDYI